jgi:hypothetical protein
MPWIESHSVLLRHRKLGGLAGDLRIKKVYALGHLHALWHAAIEQQEDGDLSSWSDEFIAQSAEFDGDAPRFVSLLTTHRWLEPNRLLHDWLDYTGLFLTRKYSTSNRELLVKIWAKHGFEYGANGKRTVSEHKLLAPNQPTNLTNQPTSLSSASENGPDPNTWQPKLVVKPKPQSGERIGPIHAWYCQQMGAEVRLDAMVERLWHDWFTAGYDEDQFKRVFKYLRGQIKNQKRNDGAVLLSNMLQPDRFGSDLALASVQRKPMQAAPAPEIATPAKPYDATKSAGLIAALRTGLSEGKA